MRLTVALPSDQRKIRALARKILNAQIARGLHCTCSSGEEHFGHAGLSCPLTNAWERAFELAAVELDFDTLAIEADGETDPS